MDHPIEGGHVEHPVGDNGDRAGTEPVMMVMEGFDDCIAGVVHRHGHQTVIAYDLYKVLDKLRKQGMTCEEALEFHQYNQLGAWVGEGTPCFIEMADQSSVAQEILKDLKLHK